MIFMGQLILIQRGWISKILWKISACLKNFFNNFQQYKCQYIQFDSLETMFAQMAKPTGKGKKNKTGRAKGRKNKNKNKINEMDILENMFSQSSESKL